jgi:ribosomal protein S18 acetylase RimI-like enzyme
MKIRSATTDDGPALGRLGALLVSVHHGFDPLRFIAPSPQTPQGYGRFLTSRVGREEAVLLVAEAGTDILGYVYGALEGPDWMALRGPAGVIYDIIVDPAHRQQGVGKQLLSDALAALTARGAPRVVLFTATPNETAQRLFAGFGFRSTMIEMTREASPGAERLLKR